MKIISQLAPIRERIKFFERKYGCSFEDFERSIGEGEESFEKWDDYIEWKAYSESLRDLTAKLEKIEDSKNISELLKSSGMVENQNYWASKKKKNSVSDGGTVN
ncbi:MAG: hypothetical protein QXG44_12845 [Candidatus Jordarchaeaceae archaeon]